MKISSANSTKKFLFLNLKERDKFLSEKSAF